MNQWVRPRQAGTRHNKRIPSGIAEPVTSSVSGLLGEQAHGQGRRRFMYQPAPQMRGAAGGIVCSPRKRPRT